MHPHPIRSVPDTDARGCAFPSLYPPRLDYVPDAIPCGFLVEREAAAVSVSGTAAADPAC